MQSITSANYTEAASTIQYPYPISGHLGFLITIPHEPPANTPWYFGENPVVQNEKRELVLKPYPELFPVGGVIPFVTDTIPYVNMAHPSYKFNRIQHTYHV
jgi:hypothetical protein